MRESAAELGNSSTKTSFGYIHTRLRNLARHALLINTGATVCLSCHIVMTLW